MEYGLWNLPSGLWQASNQSNIPLEPRTYYAPGNGLPPGVFHSEPHYPGSTSYRHQTEYMGTKSDGVGRPIVSSMSDDKNHMDAVLSMPGDVMEPRSMESISCDSVPMQLPHSPTDEDRKESNGMKSSPIYDGSNDPGIAVAALKSEATADYLKQQGYHHPVYNMYFTHIAATAGSKMESASDVEGEDGNSQLSESATVTANTAAAPKSEFNGNGQSESGRSPNSSIEPSSNAGYECGECGLVADTRPALKKHILFSHPDPQLADDLMRKMPSVPNSCPMTSCRFRTNERIDMEAHMARHVSEGFSGNSKKKACPVTLQRVRYEREEYRCQLCAYSCTIEKAFFKHLKVHTMGGQSGPVKISCVICGKDRASEVDMNKHMKRHRDDRYFCCDICIFKTVQLKKLIQHRRMHTGEKPHLCPHCSYRSARRDNLRSHVRRVHKKENLYCDTFTPRGLLVTPSAGATAASPSSNQPDQQD